MSTDELFTKLAIAIEVLSRESYLLGRSEPKRSGNGRANYERRRDNALQDIDRFTTQLRQLVGNGGDTERESGSTDA